MISVIHFLNLDKILRLNIFKGIVLSGIWFYHQENAQLVLFIHFSAICICSARRRLVLEGGAATSEPFCKTETVVSNHCTST